MAKRKSGLRQSENGVADLPLSIFFRQLDGFLDGVHYSDGDWSATQTVAPANVQLLAIGPSAAMLGWDLIEYEEEGARNWMWYATTPLCVPSRYSCLTGRFASNCTAPAASRAITTSSQ